jgi:parallel beta-helix repeat protein
MKHKKTVLIVFIVISILGVQIVSELHVPRFSQDAKADGTGNFPPPTQGEWIITNDTYLSNENLIIQGNITIENGGILTLDHTTLQLNGENYGDILIWVKEGGELNIINNSVLKQGDTQINYDFVFENGSRGSILNSTIRDCGWDDGETFQSTSGLLIESDDVIIENSILKKNFYGIIIVGASPIIKNNNITDNIKYGIFILTSTLEITGNDISLNPIGISSYRSELHLLDNDIFDNGDGSKFYISDVFITNGEISSNDPADCETGECSADETGKGVYVSFTTLIMENVLVDENSEGLIAAYSELTVRNSTFSRNSDDGILGENSQISLYNNIFSNNDGYGIRWKYMELEVDSTNSFIQNYGEGRIRFEWEVKVNVTDSKGDHVTTATVTLDNSASTFRSVGFSNPSGFIEFDVPEYEIANNGSTIFHNPYTLSAKKTASWDNVEYSNQTTIDITDNMDIDITIPLKKPDVRVDSVDFSSDPKVDSDIKIIVKFTNIGGAQARNVTVIVILMDPSNSTTRINSTKISVNPAESTEVRLSWVPEKTGETTIRVSLNTNYDEQDKSNNEMELVVNVKEDVPFYEEPYFVAGIVSSVIILVGIAIYLLTLRKKSKDE